MSNTVDHMISILRAGDLPHQRRINIVQMKARTLAHEPFKFVPVDLMVFDEAHPVKK